MDKAPVYLTGLIVTSLIVTSLIVASLIVTTVMALEVVDTIARPSRQFWAAMGECGKRQRIKNARCDSGHSFDWMIIDA